MNTADIRALLNNLDSLNGTLNENIWGYADAPGGTEVRIYVGHEISLTQEFIDDYRDVLDNISNLLSSTTDELDDTNETIINRIEDITTQLNQFDFTDSIIELFNFSRTEYARDKMDENSIEINEDTLDDYAERFGQEAFEIKDELASNAREDLLELESTTERLSQELENIVNELDVI